MNIVENGQDFREAPKCVDPDGKRKARKIDKIARKIFPLVFLVFNIVYWIAYSIDNIDEDSK